jgi:hypothetical protein
MLLTGETEDQHMDNESISTVTEDAASPAGMAAPAAVKAPPPPVPHRLGEVVKQVKAQLISGYEKRVGSNPYDSQLGTPSRDVWGIRKRA